MIELSEALDNLSYKPSIGELLDDTHVNLTSTMSASQIQALVDAQPKDLAGKALTFQLGNGTYTIGQQLNFNDFHSGKLCMEIVQTQA